MKSRSIRYYFFTSIATVLVASVLVMGIVQAMLARAYFRAERQRLLMQVAFVVSEEARTGSLTALSIAAGSIDNMAQVAGALVLLTDTDGVVSFGMGPGAPEPGTQIREDIINALETDGQYQETGRLGSIYGKNFYTSALPLYDGGGTRLGYVFASSDASSLADYLQDTISMFVLSAAAVLFISGMLALVLSNRTVTPIRRISEAATRFAEGDYSARVPVEGGDELAALSVTFNEMANSIQATDISRRSFMGNIAHELRTPMTTVKGFIDAIRDGTVPPEVRDRYLAVVGDEVARLARLTRNMLDISRLEVGGSAPDNSVFDISRTISVMLAGTERRMSEKKLSCDVPKNNEGAFVLADEDFTHQILFNLLDNAIKFSNEGGCVSVRVEKAKNFVTVGIRNTGEVIAKDALPHIFDRFYKVDKSRSGPSHGVGLGLHISKVLVNLMGGRIWAESEEHKYSEVLFTLPADAPKRPVKSKKKEDKEAKNRTVF